MPPAPPCGGDDEAEPRPLRGANTNRIGVDLGADDVLTCSLYVIPVDARGEPEPTPGQGLELPTTGVLGTSSDRQPTKSQVFLLMVALATGGSGLLVAWNR